MTEVSFHTGVADVLAHAHRLLRKATRQGARVALCADEALLARLDAVLWTADPLDFIPHLRLPAEGGVAARHAPTPVWLVAPPQVTAPALPVHEVLVNLGAETPPGFESFERVIEIVARDEDAVRAGRRRWKHYVERGYRIEHHVMGTAA